MSDQITISRLPKDDAKREYFGYSVELNGERQGYLGKDEYNGWEFAQDENSEV